MHYTTCQQAHFDIEYGLETHPAMLKALLLPVLVKKRSVFEVTAVDSPLSAVDVDGELLPTMLAGTVDPTPPTMQLPSTPHPWPAGQPNVPQHM